MKKLLSILLILALALGFTAAAAEEPNGKVTIGTISINGAFTLKCGLPEGYKIMPLRVTDSEVRALLYSGEEGNPRMYLSVAFDETYADVDRMNDLDDEAMDLLEQSFVANDPTVEISYDETGLGTRLLIAKQTEDKPNYIDFLSVYKGYFVEFVMVASDKDMTKELTDDQLALCIDFLTDLDFVPENLDEQSASEAAGQTWIAGLSDYDRDLNQLQAALKRPIILDPETVAGLKAGDTLTIGTEEIAVETIEPLDEGDWTVNDEIILTTYEDGVHASLYEHEYMEVFATLMLDVPEDLEFQDGIDPATGEILDEPTVHTAAEFIEILQAGEESGDPGFTADNVYISLDAEGKLTLVQRFYVPWQ